MLRRMLISSGSSPKSSTPYCAAILAARLAEDMFFMAALGANVGSHVLDDAEDRNVHFFEHHETPYGRPSKRYPAEWSPPRRRSEELPEKRQLDVAGSRGHINDEVIQIFPVRLL